MLVTMNELLQDAQEQKYGIGYFNTINLEMARAVIESAEELHAPVMVGIAEVILPKTPLQLAADYLIPMAKRAGVPVCVHYDHGMTFECCMEALRLGFTSIMFDRSKFSYAENVAQMAKMTEICHAMNVSVEGELGHVGDYIPEGTSYVPSEYFTDPAVAADYVRQTGIDALAIAVGNAHGDYKLPPKLDFDRITAIKEAAGLPLVLHGGSGLSDADFAEAIQRGICKVNIFTEINKAGKAGVEAGLQAGAKNAMDLLPYTLSAMKTVAAEKLRLFGSAGKA